MESGYTHAFRVQVGDGEPQFLQCCPHWLCRLPSTIEIMDAHYWHESGNLSALYNSSNPITSAVRDGIKAYDAGLKEAIHEKAKRDAKRRAAEQQ